MKHQKPHRNKYAAKAGQTASQRAEAEFQHSMTRSRNYYANKRKG